MKILEQTEHYDGERPLVKPEKIHYPKEELLRLQEIIIESKRFTKLGFRTEGGFVGEHDRITGEPIPEHISARWQDLDKLIDGLIQTSQYLESEEFDPGFNRYSYCFWICIYSSFLRW